MKLDGKWVVRKEGKGDAIPARVPGDVYADLLRAKEIEDPFYREYEWDVKELLTPGKNSISVRLDSVIPYTEEQQKKRAIACWGVGGMSAAHYGWVRKEQCNFGWDWGPSLVTCGIWRSIRIVGYSTARLSDVRIDQAHKAGAVTLSVAVAAEARSRKALSVRVTASFKGKVVVEKTATLSARKSQLELKIEDPQLWWPNGMGEQPLYDVQVELLAGADTVLDASTRRIGLRTLQLDRHKDEWGESFQFVANGVPFFSKGANWIPADAIQERMTPKAYRSLLESAVDAHMNMLRVWGGGLYENDVFYELCDELGICIWQDFMFSCSAYPLFDKSFMKNVEAEARDNIRRLRHHPCIALWCGNNELEQGLVGDKWTPYCMSWKDYGKLFDKLLPELVAGTASGQ